MYDPDAIAPARMSATTREICCGPLRAWTQHCIPQPAAQGQPVSWLAGDGELSLDAAHRLLPGVPPTATENGSSKACSATT